VPKGMAVADGEQVGEGVNVRQPLAHGRQQDEFAPPVPRWVIPYRQHSHQTKDV
jgi:hypothetical protein